MKSTDIPRKIGPNYFSNSLLISPPISAPRSTCDNAKITARITIKSLLIILLSSVFISGSFGSPDESSGTYTLKIDLPPETIYDVTATDILSAGLVYEPDTLTISGAARAATTTISSPNDGSKPVTITWNFGQVNNSADQDLLIKFRAVVADVPSNHEGTVLAPGKASLSWKDKEGNVYTSSAQSDSVKIIEPDLEVVRRFEPSSGWRRDEVACVLSLRHSLRSTADAFDVNILESLPQGLSYVPGSMQMENGPADGTMDSSRPQELLWHIPQLDRFWSGDQKIQLRYRAVIDKHVMPGDALDCNATLAWTSASGGNPDVRQYTRTSKSRIMLTPRQPDLKISLTDSPDPVRPGDKLNYTISYLNRGGYALGAVVETDYDGNVVFFSASPSPDTGTNNRWTLGELGKDDPGIIKITVQASPTLTDGSSLSSSARISSADGATAQASATTKVSSTAPLLSIEKTASAMLIRPGGTLNYTISYSNRRATNVNNVTVTDIVDKNLLFDPRDSTPRPTRVWTDGEGTHLWWNATALNSQTFAPGGSGKIELRVALPSDPPHPQFDRVYNLYKIGSDGTVGSLNTLETFVVHSLYVRKKADKETYSEGEMVNYTIIYGNDLAVDAENAVITDVLPDLNYMEYQGAVPQPTAMSGNVLIWNIGRIRSRESGTIQLYAKIKENLSELKFKSSSSVSGQGYIRFDQRLNTAQRPDRLTNYVNITAYYPYYLGTPDNDSSSATIRLADALGTEVDILGHGSGSYKREDETRLLTKNKTIQVKTSLSERYSPSSFALPQGRSISYSSKWSEAQSAKNRITGASFNERYMYATRIDRNSTLKLDKNGSTLASETSFKGAAHIGVLKKSSTSETSKGTPIFESQEDYLGSFKVNTNVDEYGKNVVSNRSVSGTGMVAADKRITKSQRSHESGTGAYQAEDKTETHTNYISKEINVTHGPVSYAYTPDVQPRLSEKWNEGMWSRSGHLSPKGANSSEPASFIGEEFSQADYLKKNTTALGLNEMNTEAEFSGIAQFKVMKKSSSNNSKNEVALYDEYMGRYKLSRKTTISGVARFDEPHLSITKVGETEPAGGTFVNYVITVVNDGNRALGPVYVLDLFPPGTEYVYSSVRPSELTGNSARWTLTNLGIGATSRIELNLTMTEDMDSVVNRVQAKGGYNDQWVSAENFSAIQLNWLSCCPPQLLAAKEAFVDPKDPMRVHYRIILKNRERSTMVANVTDHLPGGMMFLNASVTPSYYRSGEVSWNILDLEPGKIRTIDYWTRALQSGTLVNQAHIDAHYLNGTDSASTDVVSSVDIGGEGYSISSSNWQPPRCFGLNCTQQGFGDEWMPCHSCGATEPQPLDVACSSCTSPTETEEGYDIP